MFKILIRALAGMSLLPSAIGLAIVSASVSDDNATPTPRANST